MHYNVTIFIIRKQSHASKETRRSTDYPERFSPFYLRIFYSPDPFGGEINR